MYTAHGHHISGTVKTNTEGAPEKMRCGGVGLCELCSREAKIVLQSLNGPFASVSHKAQLGLGDIHNRFGFHPGTENSIPKHERVRQLFINFAQELNLILPSGRDAEISFTELETSAMWAHKAIAMEDPVE